MKYEVQKFLFPDIEKVLTAFRGLQNVDNSGMGNLIQVIVACGIRKKQEELKNLSAEEALDIFNKVMQENEGFFQKFAKDVPNQIASILKSK